MHLTLLLDYDLSMNNWLKTTMLLFIPLIFIPILVFTAKKYQTPKIISKPTPTPITSTPTPTAAPKKAGADLSYIWIYTDENVKVVVKNASNISVGEEFIEQPLQDPVSGKKAGKPTKEFLYAKPSSENYTVAISVLKEEGYNLLALLYDRQGNHKSSSFSGTLKPKENIIYIINFYKEDSTRSKIEIQ